MNKKILLSVVASALLSTSAFAGTVTLPTGHTTITTESYMQNGMDELDLGQIVYNAGNDAANNNNFSEQERAGGSVSDPMVGFDISNLEFEYHQVGAAVVAGFDAHGKGLTPLEIRAILGQDDLVNDLLEADHFHDTILADVDDLTDSVADFDQINFENGKAFAQYDGSSDTEVKNQHSYVITDGAAQIVIPVKAIKDRVNDVEVTLYSQTLDNNVIDKATYDASITVAPQFKVACVRKFDGLINFENDRVSFVNPEHGERIGNDPAATTNDTLITSDRMIFTINNNRDDAVGTRWMGGHGTQFTFTATNNDNAFEAWTDSTVSVYSTPANPSNVDTDKATNVPDATYTLAAGTKLTAAPASFVYDVLTKEFVVTYDDALLSMGTTSFVVDLIKPDGQAPLRAVQFITPTADLEGGLTLDDATVNGADANHGAVDHAVVNTTDSSDVIVPQVAADFNITTAGEWIDHAYVAQIAGATDDANVVSKVFVVNRSCAAVTPKFKLVKDGKIVTVEAPEALAPDTQKVYKVAEMRAMAVVADPANTSAAADLGDGVYAVEVILPGVAENFYVYAQAKHITLGQFKDLPVYNTSNRD